MIAPESSVGVPQGAPLTVQSARTLVDLLLVRGATPSRLAARHKAAGQWQQVTWGQMLTRIRKVGEGLTALGIEPGDRVAILSTSRYEWALANFGIFAAGATAVPIYPSNTPKEIELVLRDSGAKAVFVDHDQADRTLAGRMARVRQIRGELPALKHVISFDLSEVDGGDWLSLSSLEEKGAARLQQNPRGLEERAAQTKPEDLAYLIYTSGTTGRPKGVMLTHANWTSQAQSLAKIGLVEADDTALLFLPLAHVFALIVFAAWLGKAITVAFAESIDRAVDNAGETSATLMTVVPRVLEKAYNKVIADGNSQPGVKGQLFAWAMRQFEEYAAARSAGQQYDSVQWSLAKRLVFTSVERKVKTRFGGKMRVFISGGAPLARKIAYFFDLIGLHVCEGYGLTETCAPTHCNLPHPGQNRIGTVGLPWPGVEVRIAEDGEVLLRGPQVMKGYYNLPAETAAALEPDGWFHTGDIGKVDSEQFLRITDRKKDLIKTSGGKYIAPQELENGLKIEPLISQVLIIGDRRKFVSALITLNEETLRELAKSSGWGDQSLADLTRRPEIAKRIQAAVDTLNSRLPSYATIKKFAVLDHDWSQESGEITPTLKVKRQVVLTKYRSLVDGFYEGERFE